MCQCFYLLNVVLAFQELSNEISMKDKPHISLLITTLKLRNYISLNNTSSCGIEKAISYHGKIEMMAL